MKKQTKETRKSRKEKTLHIMAVGGLITLLGMGIFAQMGWLPKTDSKTGERNGWFGVKIAKDSKSSNWNPFAESKPQPKRVVPSLSKEYIYAGDRMLAVEDYAQPTPTITPTPTPGGGGGGTPTPTPTATPTPTPTPCIPGPITLNQCNASGGYWNYQTCQCEELTEE